MIFTPSRPRLNRSLTSPSPHATTQTPPNQSNLSTPFRLRATITMKAHLQQLLALGLVVNTPVAARRGSDLARDELSWAIPRATGVVKLSDSGVDPVPTLAPRYSPQFNPLRKRADDVCGYVSGESSKSQNQKGKRKRKRTNPSCPPPSYQPIPLVATALVASRP